MNTNKHQAKAKSKLSMDRTILWAFSLTAIGVGYILYLIEKPFIGIGLMLAGVLINPVYFYLQHKILGRRAKWYINALLPLGVLILAVSINLAIDTTVDRKADQVLQDAYTLIEEGHLDSAKAIIKKAAPLYSSPTNNASALQNDIKQALSIDHARDVLMKMNDKEYEAWKTTPDTHHFFSSPYLNERFTALLQEQSSNRAELLAAQKEKQQAKARKKQIEQMFSAFDGSHRGLSKYIKSKMNNPDSYDHVETRFLDDGDQVMIFCTFRGTNSFNAIVTNKVTARSDLNGNITEIIAWE